MELQHWCRAFLTVGPARRWVASGVDTRSGSAGQIPTAQPPGAHLGDRHRGRAGVGAAAAASPAQHLRHDGRVQLCAGDTRRVAQVLLQPRGAGHHAKAHQRKRGDRHERERGESPGEGAADRPGAHLRDAPRVTASLQAVDWIATGRQRPSACNPQWRGILDPLMTYCRHVSR